MAMSQSEDEYMSQLQDVFDSCDEGRTGSLGRNQLMELFQKLQLEEYTKDILPQLLRSEADRQVSFNEFKDVFVKLLCQIMADQDGSLPSRSNTPSPVISLDEASAVSPKLIMGNKRYGRRSKPLVLSDLASSSDMDTDSEIGKRPSQFRASKHSSQASTQDEDSDGRTTPKKLKKDGSQPASEEDEKYMFEAEGQLNLALTDQSNAAHFQTEEEELRSIWVTLGVGENGYLTILELAKVCYHIGLEEMNKDELQQLFEKLDVDCDGKVGFQEFCQGLFQHTPSTSVCVTPRSITTPTPRSMSAQKKLKFMSTPTSEERTTPSIVVGSGTSGFFSTIDPETTGFAKVEDVADLWETYNVSQGVEIIQALGFDTKTKVNLSELSFVLEHELMSADDQGALHQAAIATFKQEIRHLNSTLEQVTWARDKLKLDLSEANARNSMLAREVDERHASMEKITENRLVSLEKRYQEQIKVLQLELDREKENVSQQSGKYKQMLDAQIEEVRGEEALLREKLLQSQKEMEKMEKDFVDLTDKLQESERQNARLETELTSADELQRKLAEYETKGVLLSPEEQMFAWKKLEQIEVENKELRDKNDELTAEVEGLKQQAVRRRSLPTQKSIQEVSRIPIKEGTPLSEYIKHTKRRATVSSLDISDDDASTTSSTTTRHRRFLPDTPDDDACSVSSVQSEKDHSENLRRELYELKNNFERERKEIEQAYKVEIAVIEEQHDQEKADLLKNIDREKAKVEEECERRMQNSMAELQRELQTNFVHEKQDIIQKCESEKNLLEQKYTDEKQKMLESLNKEYNLDLDNQVSQTKVKYEQEKGLLNTSLQRADVTIKEKENRITELENSVKSLEVELKNYVNNPNTNDTVVELQNENSNLKAKLEQERKDWEQVFDQEKDEFKEKFELYEFTVAQYESSLKDLQMHKEELEIERDSLKHKLEESKVEGEGAALSEERLAVELEKQRNELESQFEREREEWDENLNSTLTEYSAALEDIGKQNAELELSLQEKAEDVDSHENKIQELEQEIDALKSRHTAEIEEYKEELCKDSGVLQTKLKDDIDKMLNEKEEDFEKEKAILCRGFKLKMSQMEEKHKQAIEEYKDKLEQAVTNPASVLDTKDNANIIGGSKESEESIARVIRVQMENEFLDQMKQVKDTFEGERQMLLEQISLLQEEVKMLEDALEMERLNQQSVTELENKLSELQKEKQQVERTNADLHATLQSTKLSLEARVDELLEEKSDLIVPVQAKAVKAALPRDTDTEKSDIENIKQEKLVIESKVEKLQLEVANAHVKLEKAEKQTSSFKLKTEEAEKQTDKYRVKLEDAEEQIANSLVKLEDAEKQIANFHVKLEDAEKETNLFRVKLEDTAKQIAGVQLQNEEMEIQHKANIQGMTDEIEELQKCLESKSKQLSDLETANKLKILEFDNLKSSLQLKSGEVERLQKTHTSTLENQLKTHSMKKEELEASYDALLKEKSFLQSDLANLKQELVRLETVGKRADSLQVMNDNLHTENDRCIETISTLQTQLLEKETEVSEHKIKLDTIESEKVILQRNLNQADDKLKNSDKKLQEYGKMEVELSLLKKEKDNLTYLVEQLQADIKASSSLADDLNKEKEKVETLQQEKQAIERGFKVTSDKLNQLSHNLLHSKMDHEKELQNLKEQTESRVELGKYVQLQMELLDQQKQLNDMQNSIEFKDCENNKELQGMEEVNKRLVDDLEDEKEGLARKLKLLQSVLDEQVDKLKHQYDESEKRSHLVVNLYKENTELMESLYKMEKKKKDAISRCYKLEDQCVVLKKMLKKVCHIAVN